MAELDKYKITLKKYFSKDIYDMERLDLSINMSRGYNYIKWVTPPRFPLLSRKYSKSLPNKAQEIIAGIALLMVLIILKSRKSKSNKK